MKTKPFLISGAAALAMLLASCGEKSSSVEESTPASESPPAAQAAAYPLEVCVVSGEKLGSMGDPVVVTHEGTEVRFCCDKCLPEFNKDPDKFVAMVKAGKSTSADHTNHNH